MTKMGYRVSKSITNLGARIAKHPVLYYILNFTWGLPMTLIGLILTLILLPFGKIRKWRYIYYIELRYGSGWGFALGTTFVCSKMNLFSGELVYHEFGHTCQNAMFGPFQIILVVLPSILRFWYRKLYSIITRKNPKTQYTDIWFEDSAENIWVTNNILYGSTKYKPQGILSVDLARRIYSEETDNGKE